MLMREEEEEEGRKEEEGDLEQQRMWMVVYHSVANNREGHMVAMGTEPPRVGSHNLEYHSKIVALWIQLRIILEPDFCPEVYWLVKTSVFRIRQLE